MSFELHEEFQWKMWLMFILQFSKEKLNSPSRRYIFQKKCRGEGFKFSPAAFLDWRKKFYLFASVKWIPKLLIIRKIDQLFWFCLYSHCWISTETVDKSLKDNIFHLQLYDMIWILRSTWLWIYIMTYKIKISES